jgi:hypothetical protein
MTASTLRFSAQAVLLATSLAVIFFPDNAPSYVRWMVVVFFIPVAADSTWRGYRAGELTTTFSKLFRNPPKTPALELLSGICGSIAIVMVLMR